MARAAATIGCPTHTSRRSAVERLQALKGKQPFEAVVDAWSETFLSALKAYPLPYTEVAAIVVGSTDAARRAAADGIATLRRTYSGVVTRKEEADDH